MQNEGKPLVTRLLSLGLGLLCFAIPALAADLKAASIRSESLEDALRDAEAREADARVDVAYARAKLDEDC